MPESDGVKHATFRAGLSAGPWGLSMTFSNILYERKEAACHGPYKPVSTLYVNLAFSTLSSVESRYCGPCVCYAHRMGFAAADLRMQQWKRRLADGLIKASLSRLWAQINTLPYTRCPMLPATRYEQLR